MGKYFGTDGFRGKAGEGLTAEHAYRIGRFLGWYYGRNHRAQIVVGKDTRRSSYMLEYALAAGITASGADAYLLHVTTTPSVSFVTRTDGFDCGVMISASHNPYYDNGIKLLNGQGEKMEQQVLDLEKYHNTAEGRVQVWFGLRTIFNNTDELCVRTKELADKYGVGIHMHVAEAIQYRSLDRDTLL